MKTFKKLAVVLFAMMLLVGCSSKTPASDDTAGDEKAFVIGGSGPTTGDYAQYGLAVQHGAEIAVAEINAAEGKELLALAFEDDKADPEIAVNAFNALMDKNMQISLLATTSGACSAVAPMVQDEGMFGLTPSGSNPAIPTVGSNIFQMCFTDPNQGKASADYIKAAFPDAVVGVIYQNSTDYSKGVYKTFVDEAAVIGLNIAAEASFGDNAASYADQVDAMKNAGCTVVFLPIYYTEAAGILTQAGDYKPTWFGVDGMDGILSGVENFDTSLAEGFYLLTPFSATATDAKTKSFVETYEKNYGETPNQFAADSYDAVYAIYNAIKDQGLTSDMSVSDITAGLIEWFTSKSFDGITGTSVTWDVSGEVTKAPMAVVIQNGEYVLAE